MTESAPSPDPREILSYLEVWADALSRAIGEIAGASFACVFQSNAPAGAAVASLDDSWIVTAASGSVRGEMSLRVPPPTVVRLAQILMSEPAAPADVTPEHREAALELLRQVSGVAATELRAQRGEVQLHLEASTAAPSWPSSFSGWFRMGEEASPILMEVHLSVALLASLRAEQTQAEVTAKTHVASAALPDPQNEKVNLDLLMDVELEVILRFGGRRILLRELLDLNPGSVITLDRQVQDPVDMLLDGRIVAKGEVVVTGGNYALRVTEVGSAGG
jgi:flagellar motor switch protein FliN